MHGELLTQLQSLVKYCKRDDSQIRKWVNDYDEHWGIKVFELVQDPRPHSSPPMLHQQPFHPHNQNHPHHDKPYEPPHRRMSDARNGGPQHSFGHNQNDSRAPHFNQQHGATQSYPNNQIKRSASYSPPSPILYTPRQSQSSVTNGSSSRSSSCAASDSYNTNEGRATGSAASVGPRNDSTTGNHGKGREQSSSRWPHVGIEPPECGNPFGDSNPRYSGAAARVSGGKGDEGGELGGNNRRVNGSGVQESSIARNIQPSSEGIQSLPSLKASGLLDSWGSPWKTGLIETHSNGLQRAPHQVSSATPRRTTPPVPNLSLLTVSHPVQRLRARPDATDLRATSTLKAVPVGLPWLAKESR